MSRHPLLSLVPLIALVAPMVADAAENGQIRGRVLQPDGNPAASIEVILSGPGIAGEITATTDASGNFRFATVPPGTHEILFVAEGFAPVRVSVDVNVGGSSFVPVSLVESSATETIVVEEELPVINTTESAFSANLSEDLLQNLPVGRSYQDAVNMLPGVYGRVDTSQGGPGDGNPSVRGEGQYGNNFYVDGVSTRDPATKTFGTNVNFDAIEDIAVYTDGAPAEFGQFAGMLVNVVIKDGGDEHHGSVGYWLDSHASGGSYPIVDLTTHEEVEKNKRRFLNHEISATAGGPIIAERLWYFASFGMGRDRYVYEGGDPEKPLISNSGNGLGKLSFFVTPDITVRYMLNTEWLGIDNYETSSQFLPESQSARRQGSMSHLGTATWSPDALTEIELKIGRVGSTLDHVPMSGDYETPTIVDLDTGQYLQNFTDFDINRRSRVGGGVSVVRVIEDLAGSHRWKAGAEYWMLNDSRDLQFTGQAERDGTEYGYKYYAMESAGYPCTAAADYQDCFAYYENDLVGALPHRGQLFSLFLQNDYQPVKPLTINIGVRYDREALLRTGVDEDGNVLLDPVFMDDLTTPDPDDIPFRMNMPAPRLGVAWDVTGDSKTLVSLNAGRYYDIGGNGFAEWGDAKSAYGYRYYEKDAEGQYALAWEQDPAGHPLIYDSTLKPARVDKITVGFKREIIPLLALGVRGIWSQTGGLPEDVDTDLDLWYITNPTSEGCDTCGKRRDYRALEFTADKKFDDRWQLLASYTLSESKGHTPGQFETASGGSWGSDGNNVGVYMDDVDYHTQADFPEWHPGGLSRQEYFDYGLGWLLDGLAGLGTSTDDAGWYGYLPYHSFHAVKINGSYTAPWGTTVGLVYEFDSGHAWQKRTYVDLYGDYMGFGEGRGTRMMPPVQYIDARVAHELDLGNDRSVELSLDVFNLPDFAQTISYYENDDENFGLTLYRQSPRAVRGGVKFRY